MKAMDNQIDEQPKIIKLFSINYARDLIYKILIDIYYARDLMFNLI